MISSITRTSVHTSSTVGWSCTMNCKGVGRNDHFLFRLQHLLWRVGGGGGGLRFGNALKKLKSWRLFSRCPRTSKHKPRMSHLQEPFLQVLENIMDYPLAKEYPTFYGTHRFTIVFTEACLFSTHWSRRTKSKSSFL